jgi:hypothetical protein
MKLLHRLEEVVSSWPNVSTHPHRFGGREFRFAAAEVGHIHLGGVVDIPFPRSLRDVLLLEGLAEEHRWVPDSGWVTFHIQNDGDLNHALWLMRISYLHYALKTASNPAEMLENESADLRLKPQFRSLLAQFLPRKEAVPRSIVA